MQLSSDAMNKLEYMYHHAGKCRFSSCDGCPFFIFEEDCQLAYYKRGEDFIAIKKLYILVNLGELVYEG